MKNMSGKSTLDAQAPNRGRWAFGPAKVPLRMQPCPLTALPRSFKVVPQQRELYVATAIWTPAPGKGEDARGVAADEAWGSCYAGMLLPQLNAIVKPL